VRGALVGLFALCLVTCLIATWRQFDLLAGLAYVAGSLAAPAAVRREAQLQVVIAPPVVFLLAVLVTQVLTAQGSSAHGSLLSVIEGTLLMLAATAPWLFAGATVCIAVAMFRGLPDCVRQFRAGFRAERKSGTWHRAASS
jgi:K+-sensing histidine kinase KdpD